ncbi:MAG: SRPBCC domain-containing protein [Vicinamibacterales bacterium]
MSSEPPVTRAVCDADVQVGGVIAAVGSRLVEAAAKKLADDFFARLSDELASRP